MEHPVEKVAKCGLCADGKFCPFHFEITPERQEVIDYLGKLCQLAQGRAMADVQSWACDEIERLSAEAERLRKWQADAVEELRDIRSQYGDEYLWRKHWEQPVVDLIQSAYCQQASFPSTEAHDG